MKQIVFTLLTVIIFSANVFGQDSTLTPDNTGADVNYLLSETTKMDWYLLRDTIKISIGSIEKRTKIKEDQVVFITRVVMNQSKDPWIDTTVVRKSDLFPIYHSSHNGQRDMTLRYDEGISGYYLDKKSEARITISENPEKSFFDSSFYPELIRLLPLEEGYAKRISIFDYNPNAKIGVISATIQSTEKTQLNINGETINVWKVATTNDISDNNAVTVLYIDQVTRKMVRKEILVDDGMVVMELAS